MRQPATWSRLSSRGHGVDPVVYSKILKNIRIATHRRPVDAPGRGAEGVVVLAGKPGASTAEATGNVVTALARGHGVDPVVYSQILKNIRIATRGRPVEAAGRGARGGAWQARRLHGWGDRQYSRGFRPGAVVSTGPHILIFSGMLE